MKNNSYRPSLNQDDKVNKRGEEYNRAVVTVQQNRKEVEITQSMMQSMVMQQQVQQEKMNLMDLAAKIDLQQKMLDNKMATMAPPLPQELPAMPNGGLPMMPQGGGYPEEEMGGYMPEDPYGQGDMAAAGMPMPPPQPMPIEQGMPMGQNGMPPLM